MALVSVSQHGATYEWGFQASDAPTITGFVARGGEFKFEPEVISEATDGEGHVDSVTVSLPAKRTITTTLTGYVTESWDATTLAQGFNFENRYFIITGITEPRRKGDYWEVSIEARSRAGVTS